MTAFLVKDMLVFVAPFRFGKIVKVYKNLFERLNERTQMHSLFGDRFLKLFAGDLQRRTKQSTSNIKDQNPEEEVAAEQVTPFSGDGHEKDSAEGNDLPNKEEQNEKDDTKPKNE